MSVHTPANIKFSDGHCIPQVGLGTWKSKSGEVTEAVKVAIDAGYRHIDCAFCYGNEAEVGAGIKAKIEDGTVKREDLFITSKLWNTFHAKDYVEPGLQASLDNLGVSYLDLYLIHWPQAYVEGKGTFPKDSNGKFIYSDAGYLDAWQEMERLVDAGKIRSIGLSNFNSQQIERVYNAARIKPANLQIELNPYLSQDQLFDFCKQKNITVTGYSPLGSADRPWAKPEDPTLLEDPKVKAIADRVGKSPAQVVLRWAIQRGIIVIPKSVTPARIQSNYQLQDFSLTDDDMQSLHSFDGEHHRSCKLEWVSDHPDYPFNIPF